MYARLVHKCFCAEVHLRCNVIIVLIFMYCYTILEPICRLDLMFVLESSLSITSINFQAFLQFITRIINQYEISTTTTQVGIVLYSLTTSADASFSISIGSILDKTQLIQTILALQQLPQSGRRTDLALNLARQQLQSFRNAVPNVVIVLTTGQSDNTGLTFQAAQFLQSLEDTEVFVVGVSTDSSAEFLDEMFAIGTNPDSDHVFTILDFERRSFNSIFKPIIEELCDGMPNNCL